MVQSKYIEGLFSEELIHCFYLAIKQNVWINLQSNNSIIIITFLIWFLSCFLTRWWKQGQVSYVFVSIHTLWRHRWCHKRVATIQIKEENNDYFPPTDLSVMSDLAF